MRFGCGRGAQVVASKRCSFSGVGFPIKNHYPRFRGAPSYPFSTSLFPTPSVDSGLECLVPYKQTEPSRTKSSLYTKRD